MKPLSTLAESLPRSGIRAVMEIASQMENVIHLEVGEPSFTTPAHIIDAAAHDAHAGFTRYTSNFGIPSLRQAIAGLGFDIRKGTGNFVLVYFRDGEEAARANEFLMTQGIIIRHVANYGLPQCLRITIGKDEENQAVIEALGKFAATR